MSTDTTEVEKSPAENKDPVKIDSLFSPEISKQLHDQGFKNCSKDESEFILGLTSFEDRVFTLNDSSQTKTKSADGSIGVAKALVCSLLSEATNPEVERKGHSLVVCSNKSQDQLVKAAQSANLKIIEPTHEVTGFENHHQLIIGSPKILADFFKSDLGRATRVGRVVVLDTLNQDLPELRLCLAEACKRGQRPQLVLVTHDSNGVISELSRSYLRSTAHFDTHYFVQSHGDGRQRMETLIESLESESLYPTLIFCKHAAEIAAVESALRNQNIRSRKLLGRNPAHKIREVMNDLKCGEARVLLCTDSSSDLLELENFPLTINFSIPSEPENYIHRTESPLGPITNRKILNIITPLDRANFDYLKRIVSARFEETRGPDTETLILRQVERIESDAVEKYSRMDDRIKELAKRLSERGRVKELIGLMLYNQENRTESYNKEQAPFKGNQRGRYNNDKSTPQLQSDRNHQHRDERDSKSDKGSAFRIGNRSSKEGFRVGEEQKETTRQKSRSESLSFSPRPPKGSHGQSGANNLARDTDNFNDDNRPDSNRARKEDNFVVNKISRLYFGKGANDGISKAMLSSLSSKEDQKADPMVLNCSVRPNYSFLDVKEENSEAILNLIKKSKDKSINNLNITKAISLTSKEKIADSSIESSQTEISAAVE